MKNAKHTPGPLKVFQYNVSVFTNKPLRETELWFDTVDQAYAYLKRHGLPSGEFEFCKIMNTGFLGIELSQAEYLQFIKESRDE